MFDNINGIAEAIGVKVSTVIAGSFGAAVSMAVIKGPIWYRFCLLLGGVATAAYVTPLISHIFDLINAESAIGFLVGMFGMSVTSAIIRTIQDVNFETLSEQLRAWFGRK
jgi:hypothetical protein